MLRAPNSLGACGRMGALCVHRLACCCLSIKTVVHWEKVGEGPNFCFCRPHRLSALCKCAPVIGLRAVEVALSTERAAHELHHAAEPQNPIRARSEEAVDNRVLGLTGRPATEHRIFRPRPPVRGTLDIWILRRHTACSNLNRQPSLHWTVRLRRWWVTTADTTVDRPRDGLPDHGCCVGCGMATPGRAGLDLVSGSLDQAPNSAFVGRLLPMRSPCLHGPWVAPVPLLRRRRADPGVERVPAHDAGRRAEGADDLDPLGQERCGLALRKPRRQPLTKFHLSHRVSSESELSWDRCGRMACLICGAGQAA